MSRPYPVGLYRLENPTCPFNEPEGDYFSSELAGQWFDINLDGALANMARVQYYSATLEAPAQLAVARVMSDELESYHALNHPIASRMRHFQDDYIIPRDGSVPIVEVDVDEAVRARDYKRIHKVAAQITRSHIGHNLIIRALKIF